MNNKSNIYDRKYIKLIYNRFFNLPRYWKLLGNFCRSYDYDHRTELIVQIRSIYFCIETCIGENINWKSYNRIIKLSTSYIIVKYIRGGLVLERFPPRGVGGADILFPRWSVKKRGKSVMWLIERLARNSGWDDTRAIFCLLLLFWFFFDSWQDEVLNIAKIGLLNRTFNSKGQVLCLLRKMWHHVYVDHDRRNIWNLTRVEMIIRRKVVYIFVLWKNIDHSVRNTKNQRGENR